MKECFEFRVYFGVQGRENQNVSVVVVVSLVLPHSHTKGPTICKDTAAIAFPTLYYLRRRLILPELVDRKGCRFCTIFKKYILR